MISIQLLGDPLLRGPGGPITGRAAYRRRIALLSILAAARGRPVGRERLVGLLWAEHTTEAARHTLSESLYVLRKELGEAAFVVVGDEVGLNREHARSDLDQFETALEEGRTEDAVRLYGGPFLDGFFVPGALEFERWAEGERDRLARVFAGALEQLAERAEAAGRPLDAAGWWRKLAAHDPFSSRVALRLAQALRDGGEHAAALRHAESHAALLHAELGVGPNAELAAFVARLRADRVPLLPRPAAPPAPSMAAEPGVHTAAAGPAGSAEDEAP
ncbi:MAG TPA: BTAD domain-containing putative transcriptional regulator, partial [Longimicrobium sp.]